jgi:hypothetical protein
MVFISAGPVYLESKETETREKAKGPSRNATAQGSSGQRPYLTSNTWAVPAAGIANGALGLHRRRSGPGGESFGIDAAPTLELAITLISAANAARPIAITNIFCLFHRGLPSFVKSLILERVRREALN